VKDDGRCSSYGAVVLSPHLDDAALSCGGQIADRVMGGERVLIVTVFAGDEPQAARSPLAQEIHRSWRLGKAAMAERRAEDVEACGILGADWAHWPFCDAIHRREPASGRPLYKSLGELMGRPHSVDQELVQHIADRLAGLAPIQALLVPLAVGSHVDHLLTRRAAESVFGAARLVYYEDYPYSRRPHAVERALETDRSGASWRSELILTSRSAVRKKMAAVDAYRSQLRSLFWGRRLARLSLWWRWRTRGGERVWVREPASVHSARPRGPRT